MNVSTKFKEMENWKKNNIMITVCLIWSSLSTADNVKMRKTHTFIDVTQKKNLNNDEHEIWKYLMKNC